MTSQSLWLIKDMKALGDVEVRMCPSDQTNEWSLLKDQFDALVRDEGMREDSIEKLCDDGDKAAVLPNG